MQNDKKTFKESGVKDLDQLDELFQQVFDLAFERYESAERGEKKGDQALRMEYSKFRKSGNYPKFRQSLKAALAEGAKVSVSVSFPAVKKP